MKIEKKDLWFIALIVVVVGIFLAISGKEKTKVVPRNDTHKEVYEVAYRNAPGPDASIFKRAFFKPAKKEAEKSCEPCHDARGIKLPPDHPPKHRCLFCHKLVP
ncbi:cytochrome C [Trichlorobacter ammonificans]|uniref:Cytochrome c n=1 Tax=Trichlorobacter ammonificans TaxID=2916410 RepID=A0ABM9DAY2_9BACT|nr:cytochrome C [Trichlorobacter ammonificans]CAH2031915.1 putative Cytochrome c [Trichlorobacter ammonificans]